MRQSNKCEEEKTMSCVKSKTKNRYFIRKRQVIIIIITLESRTAGLIGVRCDEVAH